MQEENNKSKRKYRKKGNFKINMIFAENGESLDKIIERAFSNYILKKK